MGKRKEHLKPCNLKWEDQVALLCCCNYRDLNLVKHQQEILEWRVTIKTTIWEITFKEYCLSFQGEIDDPLWWPLKGAASRKREEEEEVAL